MNKIILLFIIIFLLSACGTNSSTSIKSYSKSNDYIETVEDFDYGYEWAEDNDIDDFSYCDDEFGSSYGGAEDGCNEYVQDYHYNGSTSFGGYGCTEDCSGHEAGYEWAEDNDIDDEDDCGGNSNSFIEGCMEYVEDNY